MKKTQRKKLERAGWKIGTVGELFDLTAAEEALLEAKLRLGSVIRTLRQRGGISQAELARKIGSSQPRVAKLENRDPEVSLDLQMKAVFASRPRAQAEFSALVGRWAAPVRAPATRVGARPRRRARASTGRRMAR